MDFYFNAPKWDPKAEGFKRKAVPNLSVTATATEWANVHEQTVIHIERGMYRNATINGTFLLARTVKLPLGELGKRRVQIYCKWFGHSLRSGKGLSVLVELPIAKVEHGYSGKIVTNISARQPVTK